MTSPRYLSPTGLKRWDECSRRWGLNYLLPNNRESSGAAAEFGSVVHSVLERYERNGTPPNADTREGRLALEGLPYLPQPSPRHWIEREFRLMVDGIPFGGKRDLVTDDPEWRVLGGTWTLVDYKTSSGRFVLTAADLHNELAANLYALGTMRELQDAEALSLYWLYFITSGRPRVLPPVETMITLPEAEAYVQALVLPRARQVWQYYGPAAPTVWTVDRVNKELAPCRASCHSYGRLCPYAAHQCKGDQPTMTDASSRVLSLRDRLTAAPAAAPAAQAAPAAPPEYDYSGAPPNVAAVLSGVDEGSRYGVAMAMGFTPPVKAPPAPLLPEQTAPVNPPEASLKTAPVAKKVKATASAPAEVESILALGLAPGEEAVFEIRIKRAQ
jgi:hypothetical protein